jgi:hypothetical protein
MVQYGKRGNWPQQQDCAAPSHRCTQVQIESPQQPENQALGDLRN